MAEPSKYKIPTLQTRSGRKRAGLKKPRGPRKWGIVPYTWWGKSLAGALIVLLSGVLALGGFIFQAAQSLPDINTIGLRTGTITFYDKNNQVIATFGTDSQIRHPVTIDQIAPIMQEATIAAEDRNFYNEGAVDFKRVLKAIYVDVITHGPQQGASTITQQLAKRAFLSSDKSLTRKVQELLIAKELNDKYTKPQILAMYMNLIYYGRGAYGVEQAAQVFFGKSASQLNLAEASLIAGLPQAPSYNDPLFNPDVGFSRMHYVLGGLVQTGKITQKQMDEVDPLIGGSNPTAAQVQLQKDHQAVILNDFKNGKPASSGPAPHFAQYVSNELQTLFQDNPNLLQGDIKVYTTLDLSVQAKAQTAVTNGVVAIGNNANNGALLMIDAHTGDIIAMVGSADFNNDAIAGQYNVTTGTRRPGSSFKPYVYETAFKNGTLKPGDIVNDTAAESKQLGGVHDFDLAYKGDISAAMSLLLSRNISTEQVMEKAQPVNVINFAHSMGITTDIQDNASSAIGTNALHMTEHVDAYAAFANGGVKVPLRSILKVQDGSGQTLYQNNTNFEQLPHVMTPGEAYTITNILKHYAKQWNLNFNIPTAGKSGTTDSFVDAWYMVYTPDYVIGTWAGHTDVNNPGEIGMNQVYGTTGPGKNIAVPFVNSLNLSKKDFTPAPNYIPDCNQKDYSTFGVDPHCPYAQQQLIVNCGTTTTTTITITPSMDATSSSDTTTTTSTQTTLSEGDSSTCPTPTPTFTDTTTNTSSGITFITPSPCVSSTTNSDTTTKTTTKKTTSVPNSAPTNQSNQTANTTTC